MVTARLWTIVLQCIEPTGWLFVVWKQSQLGTVGQHGQHLEPATLLQCFRCCHCRALVGVDWIFNGWGGLYGTWDNDRLVARKVCEIERAPYVSVDMVLEGGSIHVDGEG